MVTTTIQMISAYFYPKIGGSENQLFTLAQTLVKQGFDIEILTQRYAQHLPAYENIKGIAVHRLSAVGKGFAASFSFLCSLFIFFLLKGRCGPVIYVNLASSPAIAAVIIGKLLRKKVIIKLGGGSHYGDIQTSYKTIIGRLKMKFLCKSSAFFIAVSSEIKEELLSHGFRGEAVVCIPNGVDTELFAPVDQNKKNELREKHHIPASSVVFIFSGRLVKGKNVDILLHRWFDLKPSKNELHLCILGDGPEKELCEKIISSSVYGETITFNGFQQNISEWYQCADVCISLSASEGLSNTLLEAMSCGLLVITTAVGGISDVIQDGDEGYLVSLDTEQSIIHAMMKCAKESHMRKTMGEKARQKIINNYAIQKISQQYKELYSRLLDR